MFNSKIDIISVAKNADGTGVLTAKVNDPSGKYSSVNVVSEQIIYAKSENKLGEESIRGYLIQSVTTSIKNFIAVIKCFDIIENDQYVPIISSDAFICERINSMDAIPSGANILISDEVTAYARNYNLVNNTGTTINSLTDTVTTLSSIKNAMDTILVSNIVTDSTQTDKTKMHYATLSQSPSSDIVRMEINGVSYYENDDFTVDRPNKIIYFDTANDDFNFENLTSSADSLRVFYKYNV